MVFTNRLGQHRAIRRGALLPVDLDPTKVGSLLSRPDEVDIPAGSTLPEHATRLREYAHRLLAEADTYDSWAADGWALIDPPPNDPWPGRLRDLGPDHAHAQPTD
ncbi:hypothetical protein [Nocardioides sp. AX2bis]|uniref:hypothetical protein n=1 Tax=Nocardioides sp. AX2bis TaxID=2653157 RepID=UPI0012F341A6|nr:hypothetical protein [Nocardioides sp. AX2bis]VXC26816.1 hypothetical protein NOCARDAX2BIS_490078 [Nocardioides sp. AX2bis]